MTVATTLWMPRASGGVPTIAAGHGQLPPAKLEELLAGVGAAIDAVGGSFTMRYTTVVVTANRG